MATVLWCYEDILLIRYLKIDITKSSEHYCYILYYLDAKIHEERHALKKENSFFLKTMYVLTYLSHPWQNSMNLNYKLFEHPV